MKKYKVNVFWTVTGTVEIEAESAEDALDIVVEGPLPTDVDYLPGSFDAEVVGED